MRIERVEIRNLRCLHPVALEPGPALNVVTGANGAGKTSLLEAIHLLAYGRSFRGRVRDGLIRTGADALEVFVEWSERESPRRRRVGLRHNGQAWSGRLDGESVAQLGELCAALAIVTFEPGSHALVMGGGETRRRYLDWGLFHVEQDFLGLWRRYARALKQRNSLLRQRVGGAQLDTWDWELAEAGEPLTTRREQYLERLQAPLQRLAPELAPTLGAARLSFHPGWKRDALSLRDALLVARERDLVTGFTSVGPHRADWRVGHDRRPGNETLSRGQAKLTALACLLAQADDFAAQRGQWPVVLLDDLASELDRDHQARLLDRLRDCGAQVFLTGTDSPEGLAPGTGLFHVEQGVIVRSG